MGAKLQKHNTRSPKRAKLFYDCHKQPDKASCITMAATKKPGIPFFSFHEMGVGGFLMQATPALMAAMANAIYWPSTSISETVLSWMPVSVDKLPAFTVMWIVTLVCTCVRCTQRVPSYVLSLTNHFVSFYYSLFAVARVHCPLCGGNCLVPPHGSGQSPSSRHGKRNLLGMDLSIALRT